MSLADVTSARSSPAPQACPECDTSASVTSDLHKYQVACTCKPSAQYASADDPGPPAPAKTDTPPALPPRPPTSVLAATNRRNNAAVGCRSDRGGAGGWGGRKYAWWCCGCGALAAALGGLLAAQHILLRAYTASPQLLETVPAAVPAAMLVLTGVCIMSLARRRNRYSYMIKVVGACCLLCALTCVLVTITTTVIHMNKLQTLKFCEYTKLTRTCTCFSAPPDAQRPGTDDEGTRCVFEGVSECGVVHGALYWCLRGVFALSVSAVLVCICSCMLAYQLLSHERKKMYWEQLELRCRSLYRPPSGQPTPAAGRPVQSACSCCAQCHPSQPAWDISLQHRFWAPGRIGNLYSPNPGTVRKNSAWSWFPWPRSNSQNSRCRLPRAPGPDSAYGFCAADAPAQPYERPYPFTQTFQRTQSGNFGQGGQFAAQTAQFVAQSGQFAGQSGQFATQSGQFASQSGQFVNQSGQFSQGFQGFSQEGFSEASGSFDATTGVWGPPPPYSPQGRSGSRHLLHQEPAATLLLPADSRRTHAHDHTHTHTQPTHTHTCRNSYMLHAVQNIEMSHNDLTRTNPDMSRINPDLARINSDLTRINSDLARINPDLARINPDLARINSELTHLAQLYPPEELARLQSMGHVSDARFNTLRGHLVPYPCQRALGMSAGNLHTDCRLEENMTIECVHQKSASKVSDQSSDSSQKQGKENLAFQNDKHSPMRASLGEMRAHAESEVYFADVSSCCNVSVKAECCMNPNVSALVGTIENHPESTSESESGSLTLTRQQRPQPQVGSKRRPRQADKYNKNQDKIKDINTSIRLTEQQIEQLNNSLRMNERADSRDRLNERFERMNDSRISERINDPRIAERVNDSRVSDRLNDSRISDRMNDSRFSDRLNETRIERMNDARISERMNETRIECIDSRDRLNDSRIDRNDPRLSESRIERMSDCRLSDRLNDSRLNERIERFNNSRISDRLNDSYLSQRDDERNDSRDRNEKIERLNDSRMSDNRMDDRRKSDLNSSIRDGKTKMPLRLQKNLPKEHPRQSSSDSGKDFFVPIQNSPLSPNTEESLLSDDDQKDQVYSNDQPESSKCLGPDSQYQGVRDGKEVLKPSHHHCYSDTNTMDSGWQSGSEKHITD